MRAKDNLDSRPCVINRISGISRCRESERPSHGNAADNESVRPRQRKSDIFISVKRILVKNGHRRTIRLPDPIVVFEESTKPDLTKIGALLLFCEMNSKCSEGI